MAVVAAAMAATACGARIPPAALDAHVAARPYAAGDQGLAALYDASVCAFALRDAAGATRTIAMPDHTFVYFTNGNSLLAVTPLAPGHYTIASVTTTESTGPYHDEDHTSVGYSNCTRALTTRPANVAIAVVAGEVTPIALPAGTLTIADVDMIDSGASEPTVRQREAAWLPAIERARHAARARLVAAVRQPRDGYDVYPNCGLFGRGTAVVHHGATPFEFYAHPDDTARFDRTRGAVLGHVSVSSQHSSGMGAGCVEKLAVAVFISDGSQLADALRQAGEWMTRDDIEGEVDVEVEGEAELL
jgi:hypothetical protein